MRAKLTCVTYFYLGWGYRLESCHYPHYQDGTFGYVVGPKIVFWFLLRRDATYWNSEGDIPIPGEQPLPE
jgi:hypothetical protein